VLFIGTQFSNLSQEFRSGISEDFKKSKFHGHALDESTAKTKKQHAIQ
jgi:hypothetical protein